MRTEDFDYRLPPELIAQQPVPERDHSRLLVVDRHSTCVDHASFRDFPRYLRSGDVVILNDSRVLRARLLGYKSTGARVEVFLLKQLDERRWEALVRPGRRLPIDSQVHFGEGFSGRVLAHTEYGGRIVQFDWQGEWDQVLDAHGEIPLPPYITAMYASPDRYQTIYARHSGSVAAPTAGLHFTREVLAEISGAGAQIAYVTLHVGLGTFRPVSVEQMEEHRMHGEYYVMSSQTADLLNQARRRGGRWWAVGTTVTRVLETVTGDDGICQPGEGTTDIFIYPPYRFKAVDALLTNFHLPRSTLLMLVSALAGRERILSAYHQAIQERYRFYSFGDAMLIKPEDENEPRVQDHS